MALRFSPDLLAAIDAMAGRRGMSRNAIISYWCSKGVESELMRYKIEGNWKAGYAFDIHTVASTYLGENQFGHGVWDNTRSEIGELVYQLKYRNNQAATPKIIEILKGLGGIEAFDFIIPVPSSKKNRPYQPVDEIAKALGTQRGVPALVNFLVKNAIGGEVKNIDDPAERAKALAGAITIQSEQDISGKRVLLLDDLYRSGVTLNICCSVLYQNAKVSEVCVLTMTKTRSKR